MISLIISLPLNGYLNECILVYTSDDTSISKHITDPIVSNNEIQHDLLTIEHSADKWKIKFNPLKSEAQEGLIEQIRYFCSKITLYKT